MKSKERFYRFSLHMILKHAQTIPDRCIQYIYTVYNISGDHPNFFSITEFAYILKFHIAYCLREPTIYRNRPCLSTNKMKQCKY